MLNILFMEEKNSSRKLSHCLVYFQFNSRALEIAICASRPEEDSSDLTYAIALHGLRLRDRESPAGWVTEGPGVSAAGVHMCRRNSESGRTEGALAAGHVKCKQDVPHRARFSAWLH